MEVGPERGPGANVRRRDAPRTGALARSVAAGGGLVGRTGGGCAGARPAHDRRVVGELSASRAGWSDVRAHRRIPPALSREQQAELKAAVQTPPAAVGIDLADWNWKVVREFVQRRFGHTLSRSSCLDYLHRLDFVLKRPKKRLVKANAERRAAFVREYALLRAAAHLSGAKLFFVDEAHFYADVDLRGKWVLRGEPALVDSTSPRWGEKASYYSAVCLETGEVEVMELEGNSCAATSVTFLQQLRAHHPEPLIVIWDNGPAHGGDALRTYLTTRTCGSAWSACRPTARTSTRMSTSGAGSAPK